MNGGTWERTTAYVANGNPNLKTYGASVAYEGEELKTTSTKYTTVYAHDTASDNTTITDNETNLNTASAANYLKNTSIYGDAVRETSTAGTGNTSWHIDSSYFLGLNSPFFVRGGHYGDGSGAGAFAFGRTNGSSYWYNGFRAVLVVE